MRRAGSKAPSADSRGVLSPVTTRATARTPIRISQSCTTGSTPRDSPSTRAAYRLRTACTPVHARAAPRAQDTGRTCCAAWKTSPTGTAAPRKSAVRAAGRYQRALSPSRLAGAAASRAGSATAAASLCAGKWTCLMGPPGTWSMTVARAHGFPWRRTTGAPGNSTTNTRTTNADCPNGASCCASVSNRYQPFQISEPSFAREGEWFGYRIRLIGQRTVSSQPFDAALTLEPTAGTLRSVLRTSLLCPEAHPAVRNPLAEGVCVESHPHRRATAAGALVAAAALLAVGMKPAPHPPTPPRRRPATPLSPTRARPPSISAPPSVRRSSPTPTRPLSRRPRPSASASRRSWSSGTSSRTPTAPRTPRTSAPTADSPCSAAT